MLCHVCIANFPETQKCPFCHLSDGLAWSQCSNHVTTLVGCPAWGPDICCVMDYHHPEHSQKATWQSQQSHKQVIFTQLFMPLTFCTTITIIWIAQQQWLWSHTRCKEFEPAVLNFCETCSQHGCPCTLLVVLNNSYGFVFLMTRKTSFHFDTTRSTICQRVLPRCEVKIAREKIKNPPNYFTTKMDACATLLNTQYIEILTRKRHASNAMMMTIDSFTHHSLAHAFLHLFVKNHFNISVTVVSWMIIRF